MWYVRIEYNHWVKWNPFAKIWVWYLTDRWMNADPITLTDDFKSNRNWRRELIHERERMLNDLKKADVYKENTDWTFSLK